MRVLNRVEKTAHGKCYVLEAEVEGRTFTARHVWPTQYNLLARTDAMALIERHLWHMLMGTIEQHMKGVAREET